MENIFYEGQIIWSMTDANGHLRHSAYADLAAQARVNALNEYGFMEQLMQHKIGPILFREESVYLKELRLTEHVKVSAELTATREDFSRFSIKSTIFRASDGTKCAEVNVDGAWLDLEKRKLAQLSGELIALFDKLPKAENLTIECK